MHLSPIFPIAIAALPILTINALPHELVKREPLLGTELLAALGTWALGNKMIPEPPPCAVGDGGFMLANEHGFEDTANYYSTWSASSNNKTFASMCYSNITSSGSFHGYLVNFTTADLEVAKCLANLHYAQNDVCISVKGSICDINDYVANGGLIENARMSGVVQKTSCKDPKGNFCRLSAEESSAMQVALASLVGKPVTQSANNPYMAFYNANDKTFAVPSNNMQLNWAYTGNSC